VNRIRDEFCPKESPQLSHAPLTAAEVQAKLIDYTPK
jgi:hypothetical protein